MTEPNINPSKRLYRTREGRVVAGVCASAFRAATDLARRPRHDSEGFFNKDGDMNVDSGSGEKQ